MRRLTKAIDEIESYRTALLANHKTWGLPTKMVCLGLLNTAITALSQVQIISPVPKEEQIGKGAQHDRVSAMIKQVNEEVHDGES